MWVCVVLFVSYSHAMLIGEDSAIQSRGGIVFCKLISCFFGVLSLVLGPKQE